MERHSQEIRSAKAKDDAHVPGKKQRWQLDRQEWRRSVWPNAWMWVEPRSRSKMNYGAKARSCDRMASVCLSVCPSVMLLGQDHIPRRLEILETNCMDSPTPSLFVAQRPSTILPGEHREILRRLWRAGAQKRQCL